MQTDLPDGFSQLLTAKLAASEADLTQVQIAQLACYASELVAWNRCVNLTRITDAEGIVTRHFLDALSATPWIPADCSLIDVGTGGGVPGIPLAIYYPGMCCTLLESIGKKVRFLNHIVTQLGLKSVRVIEERAESLCQQPHYAAGYDRVLTRYVASLRKSVRYCLRLARPGGLFIAYKGSDALGEIEDARPTIQKHGGCVLDARRVTEHRTLVIIQKG